MTPLERAAQAIVAARINEPNYDGDWDEYDLKAARAVLAAIREPSDEQLIEAQRAMFKATQSAPPSSAIATGYTAMIDAALAEGE